MDLVSVYIPTHNRSKLLQRAIDSVISQSYSNIELIVVNDGSIDNTNDILMSYQKKHNVVILTNEYPLGACNARNKAISVAKGKYITGLDDDDEFKSTHIENLVHYFDDKYSFIATSLIERTVSDDRLRNLDCGVISLKELLHYNKVGNQVFTLTERFKLIGGFDESLPAFQDYDMWVRLCEKFGNALKIDLRSYIWHTAHEHLRISQNKEKRLFAMSRFIEKHQHHMSNSQLKSMKLIEIKLSGEKLNFTSLICLINKNNYKSAIALYLNTSLFTIKKLFDKYRFKRFSK